MSKPSKTIDRSHAQSSQQGLALVARPADHPLDENKNLKELATMIALNDRDEVFAIAKRMIHQGKPSLMPSVPQLVSVEEVAMKFGLCTRSIWRLVAKGDLPQPILVGSARRWYAADIENYLQMLTEKRDGIQRRRCA